MEAIGSEVGQKMRSAIKAKLMELGCYVDDELPDYVMVMVANKRTRSQMEDDLQLFLTNNTEAFVSWLHQVLQKLQEVTINTNLVANVKKSKVKRSLEESSLKKERKEKDKKKDKEKFKAKQKVKAKKSKKDKRSSSKEPERIRPNVPPLLMNLEKESSPSITDVFAGQILKSHGIKSNTPTLLDEINKESSLLELIGNGKSTRKLLKRNRFPIIDPNTVSLGSEQGTNLTSDLSKVDSLPSISDLDVDSSMAVLTGLPRAEKIKEMNEINAKIQTLKRRLVEQIESGSEDEDFINLRTEAEELMGVDFNEDNLMPPISLQLSAPVPEIKTPPHEIQAEAPEEEESLTPVKTPPLPKPREVITAPNKSPPRVLPELPLIELNLPKRPLRDRLGVRPYSVAVSSEGAFITRTVNMVNPYQSSKEKSDSKHDSNSDRMQLDKPSRSTNDRGSVRNRLTMRDEPERSHAKEPKSSSKEEPVVKRRIGSRVVPLIPQREEEAQVAVASVVRAPPRPSGMSGAPHSQLLMRAVADAHKSLLSMPPKNNTETTPKKKAHVLPMRRNVDPKKIIIEVSSNNIPNPNSYERRNSNSDFEIDIDTESLGDMESDGDCRKNISRHKEDASEYVPEPVRKKVTNFKSVDYVPTHIEMNNRSGKADDPVISRILHFKNEKPEPSGKDPQFVVTLDGLDPNIFLEKKLVKETQEDELKDSKVENAADGELTGDKNKDTEDEKKTNGSEKTAEERAKENPLHRTNIKISLSNLSNQKSLQKTKSINEVSVDSSSNSKENSGNKNSVSMETEQISNNTSPKKSSGSKRKLEEDLKFNHKDSFSPIVFRDDTKWKHDGDQVDSIGTSKYDSLPSLPPDKKHKSSLTLVAREATCRFFPDCRLGSACEFYHPASLVAAPGPTPPACRAFPACVFGDNCAYGHPMCKFDKLCTRKGCPYTHGAGKTKTKKLVNQVASMISPAVASRVVPVSNYKSISAVPLPPICKFYPSCSNLSCHFYHPKPCHFGKFCINKVECNFYHHDMPSAAKWSS